MIKQINFKGEYPIQRLRSSFQHLNLIKINDKVYKILLN